MYYLGQLAYQIDSLDEILFNHCATGSSNIHRIIDKIVLSILSSARKKFDKFDRSTCISNRQPGRNFI